MNYALIFAWIGFTAACALAESNSQQPGKPKYLIDPHWMYNIIRLCFATLALYPMWPDWITMSIHLAVFALSFSFIHNGIYYEVWGKLYPEKVSPEHYHFFGSPPSRGKGKIDFNGTTRLIMFIISILIIVIYEIIT